MGVPHLSLCISCLVWRWQPGRHGQNEGRPVLGEMDVIEDLTPDGQLNCSLYHEEPCALRLTVSGFWLFRVGRD